MSEKMGKYTPFGVWAFIMVATLLEAFLSSFYWRVYPTLVDSIIVALIWSQVATVALFYMHLKYEERGIKIFAIVPIVFLVALIVALIGSVQH
ncbi:MAG: cytochrome C oxidase subunit IV family protein [Conexivisphaerales archaeon]